MDHATSAKYIQRICGAIRGVLQDECPPSGISARETQIPLNHADGLCKIFQLTVFIVPGRSPVILEVDVEGNPIKKRALE
jgi:hypothetical protein